MKRKESAFMYLLNDIFLFSKQAKFFFTIVLQPFILPGAVFIILFPYFFITGKWNIQNAWLQLVTYPALVSNVFLSYVVLQKYFGARRIFIAWLIELFISAFIVYLMLLE